MSLGQFLRDKIVAGLTAPVSNTPPVVGSVVFNSVIPLSTGSRSFMAQKTVNGPLTFTVSAAPVQNSEAFLRLVADGVNVPTFTGMLSQLGSTYDNRKGIINTIRFFYDGYDTWFYSTQAIGATPPDGTAPTLSNASTTVVTDVAATATVTTNEGEGTLFYMISTNVTETAATVKAGSKQTVLAAGTISVNYNGLISSTRYYTHFLHRDLSGNESAVLNGSGFWTQAPPDTVAPKLTYPSGTQTGQTTATGTVTTDEANGTLYRYVSTNPTESAATIKAANLTQVVTVTGVQNVTYTGLTANTVYYSHYLHRDAAGNESSVVDSASFTTAPLVTYQRLTSLSATTIESGSNPYTYTGNGGAAASEVGGVTLKSLPANTDGWIEFIVTVPNEVYAGFRHTSSPTIIDNIRFGIDARGTNGSIPASYMRFGTLVSTGVNAANLVPQTGDRIRLARVGTVFKSQIARSATPKNFVDIDSINYGSAPQFWINFIMLNTSAIQIVDSSGFA